MFAVRLSDHVTEASLRPPHPIPYQGSKRQLAAVILPLFPPHVNRLVEPFAGSAAVSLAAAVANKAQAFWLNDSNSPLMEIWRALLDCPDSLADRYEAIWAAQAGREIPYFYEIRDAFNRDPSPDRLLFLLTRVVKAAVRYNANGELNQSPDKRRCGTRPSTMRRHIREASTLLAGRTRVSSLDYADVLAQCSHDDLVYMDPPYQGVCLGRDARYISGLEFDRFMASLADLNVREVKFILSYDGRTGDKQHGQDLPAHLGLTQLEIHVGRSSQATLLGRTDETVESLYVSPALAEILGSRVDLRRSAPLVESLF